MPIFGSHIAVAVSSEYAGPGVRVESGPSLTRGESPSMNIRLLQVSWARFSAYFESESIKLKELTRFVEVVAGIGNPEAYSFVSDVRDGGLVRDRDPCTEWLSSLHAHCFVYF